jgi:hypothetical protein
MNLNDNDIPIIDYKINKLDDNKILNVIKKYGIIVIKNYYNKDILDNILSEFELIFQNRKKKIEILDKENCSNDERIFHAQKYSKFIKEKFADDKLFNMCAKHFNNKGLRKKTLINRLVYEEGKIKNSGAGWHRDNHHRQFKAIMYLTDVTEKNGNFQWITNSSKKFIGYPPPRTKNYNTRFHDKIIDYILLKFKKCKLHNIVGEKGTVILANTTYIHRGNIIKEGERKAITQYFF